MRRVWRGRVLFRSTNRGTLRLCLGGNSSGVGGSNLNFELLGRRLLPILPLLGPSVRLDVPTSHVPAARRAKVGVAASASASAPASSSLARGRLESRRNTLGACLLLQGTRRGEVSYPGPTRRRAGRTVTPTRRRTFSSTTLLDGQRFLRSSIHLATASGVSSAIPVPSITAL